MVSGRRRFSEGSATACGSYERLALRGVARRRTNNKSLWPRWPLSCGLGPREGARTASGGTCRCTRLPEARNQQRRASCVALLRPACVLLQACKALHAARRKAVEQRVNAALEGSLGSGEADLSRLLLRGYYWLGGSDCPHAAYDGLQTQPTGSRL